MAGSACSSTAYTGCGGYVSIDSFQLARVTLWSLELSAAGVRYNSSDSRGWTKFLASVKTGTGTIDVVSDSECPQYVYIQPGWCFSLALWSRRGSTSGEGLEFYVPVAVCVTHGLIVDISRSEVVGGTFGWEADGPVYFPSDLDDPPLAQFPAIAPDIPNTGLSG